MGIYISGVGNYLPSKIVKNEWFEERLDTTDEWIQRKVGIKERRMADPSETTSDLALKASLEAIKDAKINAEEIELIVLATSSPDMIQPPTASILQGKLKAINAAAFDVGAVCAGFPFALNTAFAMQKTFKYKHVLVVAAETYSRILDYNDRSTCVFFGDGAGAVVLSVDDNKEGIIDGFMMSEGDKSEVIQFQGGGAKYPTSMKTIKENLHKFEMDGKKVWNFAIRALPYATKKILENNDYSVTDLNFIVFHQANINIIKNGLESLNLDFKKTHTTIEKYANTSGASIPITLADAYKKKLLKSGDLVVFVGFGGGLSYGSTLLKWEK